MVKYEKPSRFQSATRGRVLAERERAAIRSMRIRDGFRGGEVQFQFVPQP